MHTVAMLHTTSLYLWHQNEPWLHWNILKEKMVPKKESD